MKVLKYFLSTVLIFSLVWSCTKDNFNDIDFLSTVQAPTNVAAVYNITQDNTGLVTITPTSEGAINYDITFGDGAQPINIKQGQTIDHIYGEGNYSVKIVANGITGLKTEVTQDLVVSFKAPTNLIVVIANDVAKSKTVNVTATADYATAFKVYFGEVTDEIPVMANIGETASYTYQNAGTYTIRVVAMSAAIATTEYTEDFAVTAILQPIISAPTPPAKNAADVISIFSNAYSNVAETNYFPDWGQGGQGSSWASFDLNGNQMLQYIKLSYQGIQFGSAVNATSMQFLHIDVWTPDVTGIDIYPIDGGGAGEKFVHKDLVANSWNSFDIPLTDFTNQGLPINNLIQFKFVASNWAAGTVFLDNIYFYASTPSAPIAPAATPSAPASTVTSVFSDAYTNITANEWNPGWGQTTTLTTVQINGNNTLKYEALNYTGIVLNYDSPTDLTNRNYVHFDYWTNDATSLGFKIVNTSQPNGATKESQVDLTSITIGAWKSVDIPLSQYTTNLTGITQLLFASSGATVYIDNLYFYQQLAAAPSTPAPTPSANAANVISVYSDAYTSITSTEWNPDWGQTTQLTGITLQGDNTLKYEALNYTGIVLDYGNPTDVSTKSFVHFDYWTNDATTLGFKLVNTNMPDGPTKEYEAPVSNITLGAWKSVDIPLSVYTTNLTGITQLLFSSSSATVYIDNLYFY